MKDIKGLYVRLNKTWLGNHTYKIMVDEPDANNCVVLQNQANNTYALKDVEELVFGIPILINGKEIFVFPDDLMYKLFQDKNIAKVTRELSDGTTYIYERSPRTWEE